MTSEMEFETGVAVDPCCNSSLCFCSDCSGDLRCYQRHGYDPIPGCVGEGTEGWDYCYDLADEKWSGLQFSLTNQIKKGADLTWGNLLGVSFEW